MGIFSSKSKPAMIPVAKPYQPPPALANVADFPTFDKYQACLERSIYGAILQNSLLPRPDANRYGTFYFALPANPNVRRPTIDIVAYPPGDAPPSLVWDGQAWQFSSPQTARYLNVGNFESLTTAARHIELGTHLRFADPSGRPAQDFYWNPKIMYLPGSSRPVGDKGPMLAAVAQSPGGLVRAAIPAAIPEAQLAQVIEPPSEYVRDFETTTF